MIVAEAPKRLAKLACPLCGNAQDVILNGFFKNKDGQPEIDPNRGYAFCNCRNVFFTSWSYMKPAVYDPAYYVKYDNQDVRTMLTKYAEQYGPVIREHKGDGTILEIGCVNPSLLDAFAARGYDTVGLDIFDHDMGKHRKIIASFEDLIVRPHADRYALIWASHIFEHFKDPIGMVQKAHTMLGPNGLLFVAMPDPYSVDWSCPNIFAHWNLDEHHIIWDLRSFCQVLEEQGFEIIMANRNFEPHFICTADYHILARKR